MVIDAAAAVAFLVDIPPGRSRLVHERIRREQALHAPHLLDVDVAHTLRRLVLQGALAPARGLVALAGLMDLPLTRYSHYPLLSRVWQLRHNLTAYDAMYVALAEALDVPLLTLDAALRDAPGHQASVEVL